MNDETIDANFESLYKKACDKTGNPSGIGALSPSDTNLKNRVFRVIGKEINNEEIQQKMSELLIEEKVS